MLEIIVNSKRLQLPVSIQLNIVKENPLFQDERIPSAYSLSFEVPPTPGNLAAMGYPERIASSGVKARQPATLLHNGMSFGQGEVLLLETGNTLKLQFKGSPLNGNMTRNMNNIEHDAYDYGHMPYHVEDIDYNDSWADSYVQGMDANASNGGNFVLAPVKIKNTEWTGDERYKGAKNGLLNYINFWNVASGSWFTGDTHYLHMPVMPFPYLKDTISAAFGTNLKSNPFASGDLARIVTVSANHPYYNMDSLLDGYLYGPTLDLWRDVFRPLLDSYESSGNQIPLAFNIKSFMQAYQFSTFLKNIMKIFGMSAYPGMQYEIEKNNDTLNREKVWNWDDKLAGKPIIKTQEAKDYNFRYSDAGSWEDSHLRAKNNMNTVFTAAMAATADEQVQFNDAVSGAILGITKTLHGTSSEPRLATDITRSAMAAKVNDTGREKYEVISDVAPLDMSIEQYWTDDKNYDGIARKHWHVPVIEKPAIDAAPKIMLWAGMANTFDGVGSYPLLLNHHTDHFGTKRFDLSLLPDGPDGLISTYHSGMKAWVEKDKKRISASFRLTPGEIRNMDIRDKIYLKGRLFFIEKLEYSLTHRDVSLVEAELVEC